MVEPAPKLPPKPVREQARVLYAYEAQNDDELTIREGDIINVISKEIEDQGWFKGELNGRVGVFPDNFVELIKVPIGNDDDKPAPPRPKAAPPATGGSSPTTASGGGTIASVTKGVTSSTGKSSSTSSVTDGNSHSSNGKITSSTNNNDSSSKTTSIFGLKKTSKPSPSSLSKTVTSPAGKQPDVVPSQETRTPPPSNESSEGIKASPDTTLSSPLSGVEPSMGSKLSHPTANRPKGPSNRRPPSYISNRDASQDNSVTPSSLMTTSLTENGSDHSPGSHSFKANGTSPSTTLKTQPEVVSSTKPSVLTSPVKGKEDPPWMVELRKTQEAKKASGVGARSSSISTSSTDGGHHPHLTDRSVSLDSSSSESSATSGQPIAPSRGCETTTTAKPPTSLTTTPSSVLSKLNSPSSRGSGDFSSRLGPFNGSDVSPSSVLKPVKPLKPTTSGNASSATSPAAASTSVAASSTSAVNAAVKSSPSTSSSSLVTSGASHQQQQASSSSITSSSSTHLSSPSTTAQQQPPTTQQQSSAESIVSGGGSCIADLQREIKILRESSVSRKEYEDLRRQVSCQAVSSFCYVGYRHDVSDLLQQIIVMNGKMSGADVVEMLIISLSSFM